MQLKDNSGYRSLADLLSSIDSRLQSERIVFSLFGDFAYFLPTNDGYCELEPRDVAFLGEFLSDLNIASFPRLTAGYSKRGVETPLILFRYGGDVDHKAPNYRHGLLIVQISVMFARIDGVIAAQEIDQIDRIIRNLDFLTEIEITELIARAYYYLYASTEMDGSPQVRDHIKVGLSREFALSRIALLSDPAKAQLVAIALSVVTSDQMVRPCEVELLQDIYRVFGWSVRAVRGDIEKFAEANYIQLGPSVIGVEMNVVDEIDDVLGEMIHDFEDY